MARFSFYKKDLLSLSILVVLILIFFWRYLDGSNLFFAADEASSDLLDFNYPQRVFLANHLKENKIPLWTPYQSNGFPFLAEAEMGVFYPINLVLFRFFDSALAFNWSIILSFVIVSVGTYLFLRNLGLNIVSSFFTSEVLPFSGFFITQLKHIQIVQAASFLPLALLFTQQIVKTQQKKYILLLSFAFTCSILAGHIPTAYSVCLFTVFFFFLRVNQQFKEKGESFKPLLLFSGSFVLTLMLSAIQLLPTIEMIPNSTRHLLSTPTFNLPLSQLITFLNPFYFGDPSRGNYDLSRSSFWESTGYIGLIPLVLSLYAFYLKDKYLSTVKILAVISLFFVLGISNTLFQFVWNFLPGLTLTRLAPRFLLFVDFFLLILSAYSVKKIATFKFNRKRVILSLIIFLSIADLWVNFFFYNGKIDSIKWQKLPQTANFLSKDSDYFRITTINQASSYNLIYEKAQGWRQDNSYYQQAKELLPATINSLFNIKSIHFPNEYTGSFSLANRSLLSSLTQQDKIMEKYSSKILGLQNVKYVLSMFSLPPQVASSFKLVFETTSYQGLPSIKIYQNPDFLPRAYLVEKASILKESDVLPHLISDDFDPKKEVVLEKDTKLPEGKYIEGKKEVKLIKDEEEKIVFEVFSPSPAFLVLTDSFYPGWKALVDGRKENILRANYAFRAITIPSGKHNVEFVFKPLSFYLGAILSLTTLSLIMLIFFFQAIFFLYKRFTK